MKQLILTVGLPRSGKSTWAKQQGLPIVNPDAIRLALYGQAFIKEAESMVWAMAQYMVKALFLAGHDTVILDATNATKERRIDWINPLWECQYIIFDAPKNICIHRALHDGREELIPIINAMYETLSFPIEAL